MVIPVALNRFGTEPAGVGVPKGSPTGQEALPVTDTQVTVVHTNPLLGASLMMAPLAAKPPMLLKVTV